MAATGLPAVRRLAGKLTMVFAVLALASVFLAVEEAAAQADTQPPNVSSHSPSAGATGVSATVNLTAAFSEPVQPSSISFVLRDASNAVVPASVTYNAASRTVTLDPQADLLRGHTYSAVIGAAIDLAGNALTAPVAWSFTTHPGFQEVTVLQGLTNPTAFQFTPNGRRPRLRSRRRALRQRRGWGQRHVR
jgi:Bacterial Ig-like domain